MKCIVVKIGEAEKHKFSQKMLIEREKGEIYKFCGNREEYASLA